MIATPEFSRPVRIDTLSREPRAMTVAANADERRALAARFELVAIESLEADAALTASNDVVTAVGTLRARVVQSCVATGVPVEALVEEPFRILFRHESAGQPDEEVELSEQECDVVFFAGANVDLGEAVAETLSLSLDPYPRARDAEARLKEAGVKSEAEAGPFAALAALKVKLAP